MKTPKQEALVNAFLSSLDGEREPLYREIMHQLSALGYQPKKERSNISFKHDLHNKQMAKFGMRTGKNPAPFFALRFSACTGYSQRFEAIVCEAITRYPSKVAGCLEQKCNYCAGAPSTHVYHYTFPDGESRAHCGAYALEIPDVSSEDLAEIKTLIVQEHDYLLTHEAEIVP